MILRLPVALGRLVVWLLGFPVPAPSGQGRLGRAQIVPPAQARSCGRWSSVFYVHGGRQARRADGDPETLRQARRELDLDRITAKQGHVRTAAPYPSRKMHKCYGIYALMSVVHAETTTTTCT